MMQALGGRVRAPHLPRVERILVHAPVGAGRQASRTRLGYESMVEPAAIHHYTYQDYLRLEADANVKHEFLAGEIYAMAGGTPEHAAIAMNVGTLLNLQLRGRPCRVFSSDLRVRVLETGLATYPDVSVVCGRLERDPEDANTVTNPTLLVEITSPSSEEHDRGPKLAHYQQIPALREIVVVSHRQRRVEVHHRDDSGTWSIRALGPGEVAALASIGCELPVDEVYRDELASTGAD
jgi:Uma2 family endonuclease